VEAAEAGEDGRLFDAGLGRALDQRRHLPRTPRAESLDQPASAILRRLLARESCERDYATLHSFPARG